MPSMLRRARPLVISAPVVPLVATMLATAVPVLPDVAVVKVARAVAPVAIAERRSTVISMMQVS